MAELHKAPATNVAGALSHLGFGAGELISMSNGRCKAFVRLCNLIEVGNKLGKLASNALVNVDKGHKMNISKLLNQALNSSALDQVKQKIGSSGSSLGGSDSLKKMGMGAVGGSLLTSLMKSGKGSTLLKVGGAAAVGALAYKVYNDYQKEKAQPQQTETFHQDDQQHSVIILKAMIAAAKSDGHIDEAEMARIREALAQANITANEQTFLEGEINKPLDPQEVAAMAHTPALASEVYLASLLVVDEQNAMETMYLNELARLLKLDDEVKKRLTEASAQG